MTQCMQLAIGWGNFLEPVRKQNRTLLMVLLRGEREVLRADKK
jgi:hypothetical protein